MSALRYGPRPVTRLIVAYNGAMFKNYSFMKSSLHCLVDTSEFHGDQDIWSSKTVANPSKAYNTLMRNAIRKAYVCEACVSCK